MKTITIRNNQFSVSDEAFAILVAKKDKTWESIQHLLVEIFTERKEWSSQEVAALVRLHFPKSKYWEDAQGRATIDVRKFNKAEFKCQGGVKPEPAKLSDAGKQGARKSATDVASIVDGLLKEEN